MDSYPFVIQCSSDKAVSKLEASLKTADIFTDVMRTNSVSSDLKGNIKAAPSEKDEIQLFKDIARFSIEHKKEIVSMYFIVGSMVFSPKFDAVI